MKKFSFLAHVASGTPVNESVALNEAAAPKQVFAVLPKGKFKAGQAIATYKSKRDATHTLEGYSNDDDQIVPLNVAAGAKVLDVTTAKGKKLVVPMLVKAGLLEEGDEYYEASATGRAGQGFSGNDWFVEVIYNAKFVKELKAAGFSGIRSSEASENFEKIMFGFVGGVLTAGEALARKPIKESFDDSADATGFMEKIGSDLNSERLESWARSTDNNFGTDTEDLLHEARDAYRKFMDAMYDAG
jgi:hypothetical protein